LSVAAVVLRRIARQLNKGENLRALRRELAYADDDPPRRKTFSGA
jgi:hypothetical protein